MPEQKKKAYSDHQAASKELLSMAQTLAVVSSNVQTLKDTLVPQVSKAASEARDGVIRLEERNTALEIRVNNLQEKLVSLESEYDTPPPHSCLETQRLSKHDDQITEQSRTLASNTKEISGLTQWRNWLASTVVVVALAILGGSFTIWQSATTSSANLASTRDDVNRHEQIIQELGKNQKTEFTKFLSKIEHYTSTRDQALLEQFTSHNKLSLEDVEAMIDTLDLSTSEKTQMRRLIKRARLRSSDQR